VVVVEQRQQFEDPLLLLLLLRLWDRQQPDELQLVDQPFN
jgi:hypothetical protein